MKSNPYTQQKTYRPAPVFAVIVTGFVFGGLALCGILFLATMSQPHNPPPTNKFPMHPGDHDEYEYTYDSEEANNRGMRQSQQLQLLNETRRQTELLQRQENNR